MTDTEEMALIAGGAAGGGTGAVGWWRRRKRKKQAQAKMIALRLFPKADPKKLDREVTNILRHRKIK